MKANHLKYYLYFILHSCALMLIGGSVIQTFMIEYGVPAESVSAYVSITQIVQVVTVIGISGIADRTKNIIKTAAWVEFLPVLLPVTLLYLAVSQNVVPAIAFIIIMAVSVIVNIFIGFDNVLAYKLPYHIFDIADYGKVTNVSGVLIGLSSTLFSAVFVYITSKYDYFNSMSVFYVIGIIFLAMAFVCVLKYKEISISHSEDKSAKINLLKYKPFTTLIIPNLARGFCNGIFVVATVIGYHYNIINSSNSGMIVLLTQAAIIIGCLIYTLLSGKNKDGIIILASSIVMAVFLPLMLVGSSTHIFLLSFFIANFAINFVNYGVPIAVTKLVDYEYMGQYSAWRMMLHTLGTAAGSGSIVFMLDTFGGIPTMIIAGICQLICGFAYYFALKNNRKAK